MSWIRKSFIHTGGPRNNGENPLDTKQNTHTFTCHLAILLKTKKKKKNFKLSYKETNIRPSIQWIRYIILSLTRLRCNFEILKARTWVVSYLGSRSVMVMSLAEHSWLVLDDVSGLIRFLSVKNPGRFGWGRGFSLDNIKTTDDMPGLSCGLCCTHSKPTWIDLIISDKFVESQSKVSISSSKPPSL